MKISIPTLEYTPTFNGGTPIFPESWFTINEWLTRGRITPQVPSFSNGNSLFQDGNTVYTVTRESLLDMFPGGDAIVSENPMVWEADKEIFDLLMPTSIVPARVPTGGIDVFPNIVKLTSTGTTAKTVGEWIDSLCEVWSNSVTNKVQIFTNPINNVFLDFHLVRAFALEFTTSNHVTLTDNTAYITTDVAQTRRAVDPENWTKQQPN